MPLDPKDQFKELYDSYSKEELVKDGREFLDNNLRIKSRKITKRFWITFGILVVIAVFFGIIAVIYVFEKTRTSADSFEKGRERRFKNYDE